ncbi:sensor domain-containing phosphodiesterase [Nakamurella antarctica]|nr:EAL domain-containing protein [Nakamurella antarctica]
MAVVTPVLPDDAREFARAESARHYVSSGQVSSGHFSSAHVASKLANTVSLAAAALGFGTVMVNILDGAMQHTIASSNFPVMRKAQEHAICNLVIKANAAVTVTSIKDDPRLCGLPVQRDSAAGGYAGVPILGRELLIIGTLCVVSPQAREVTGPELEVLRNFAAIVQDQLELVRRVDEGSVPPSGEIAHLANAIADGEIVPWYQAIVDLESGATIGYEALARWPHNGDPVDFVAQAERHDLAVQLDRSVIRQVVIDLRRWHRTDPKLTMNVNVSARHFENSADIDVLIALFAAAGIDTRLINIELTETTRLTRATQASSLVDRLRASGFKVWLDDFGTGWSSLESLLLFQIDGIKVDRDVTAALGLPEGRAVLRSLMTLAAELGLATTVEGVQTAAQAQRAAEMGCSFGQGYLWSRAVPATSIEIAG